MTKVLSPFQLFRMQRSVASPRARRALAQRNIDAKAVRGNGPNGRIVEADVLQYQPPVVAPVAAARSVSVVSHLRTEVDASQLLQLSEKTGVSVTDFMLKAFICGLKASSSEVSVGLTQSDGNSVSIPDAGNLNLKELAKLRGELAEGSADAPKNVLHNAGRGRVDEHDVALGDGQEMVLCVGSIAARPFVVDGELAVRATVKLCLGFDSLAVNESKARGIFEQVIELIEEPKLMAFY